MYILYQLLIETIPTYFYWLICRKQNLFKVKYWRKDFFFLISGFWQILTGCCLPPDFYFNNMQINRWQNTLFTEHLRTTASETNRASFLRSFFFLWINLFCFIGDVYCRNFLKFWYWCAENNFMLFIQFRMKLFPIAVVSLLWKNLIFFLLT